MSKKPHTCRSWFRFNLQTMMALVTLHCFLIGYLGWAKNWIRQRHEFLEVHEGDIVTVVLPPSTSRSAPWQLTLLGEVGVSDLGWRAETRSEARWDEQYETLKQLFPEAEVFVYDQP